MTDPNVRGNLVLSIAALDVLSRSLPVGAWVPRGLRRALLVVATSGEHVRAVRLAVDMIDRGRGRDARDDA